MTLLQARPRERQKHGVRQREIPLKKKSTNYFQTTFILARPSVLIFQKQKNKYIESYLYIFSGLSMRGEREPEHVGMGNPMVGVVDGARVSWPTTMCYRFRDTPPTRRPNAIHTATQSTPTAALGWHLWNHSTRAISASVQPCHPSHCPTQNQTPASMRPNINTTLQLLEGVKEVSPHRKQD